jgi:hypothetical protein
MHVVDAIVSTAMDSSAFDPHDCCSCQLHRWHGCAHGCVAFDGCSKTTRSSNKRLTCRRFEIAMSYFWISRIRAPRSCRRSDASHPTCWSSTIIARHWIGFEALRIHHMNISIASTTRPPSWHGSTCFHLQVFRRCSCMSKTPICIRVRCPTTPRFNRGSIRTYTIRFSTTPHFIRRCKRHRWLNAWPIDHARSKPFSKLRNPVSSIKPFNTCPTRQRFA